MITDENSVLVSSTLEGAAETLSKPVPATPVSPVTTTGQLADDEVDSPSPTRPTSLRTPDSAAESNSAEIDPAQLLKLVKELLGREKLSSDPSVAFLLTRDPPDTPENSKDVSAEGNPSQPLGRCGVNISDLLQHSAVLALGNVTEANLVEAIKSVGSHLIEYDETRKRAYPVLKPLRNIIVLRDLPDAEETAVQSILCQSSTLLESVSESPSTPDSESAGSDWQKISAKVFEIRKEFGGNWFVTLESEKLAQQVAFDLINKQHEGRPVRVGVKSQTQYVPLQEMPTMLINPINHPFGYLNQELYCGRQLKQDGRGDGGYRGNRRGNNISARGGRNLKNGKEVDGGGSNSNPSNGYRGYGNQSNRNSGRNRNSKMDGRSYQTAKEILSKNTMNAYSILSTDFPPLGNGPVLRYTHDELVSMNVSGSGSGANKPILDEKTTTNEEITKIVNSDNNESSVQSNNKIEQIEVSGDSVNPLVITSSV